jgi:bacterioferritin
MVALIRHRPARNIVPPKLFAGVKAVANQPGAKAVPEKPFLSDIKTLRERARQHIENGAVTEGYRADRDTVVKLLNEALATEIVCVLRYKRHYFMASGIHAEGVAAEFLQHANEEQGHADLIGQRIVQLGGEPDLNPEGLSTRSHAEYVEGENLLDMIKEDLVAERIAIDSYREMINYVGNDDPTTRRMLEGILAVEEEHADDLVNLLTEIGG